MTPRVLVGGEAGTAGGFDPAVAHPGDTIATFGQCHVMGDQHQRAVMCTTKPEHQLDHLFAGGLIQISGWLVGQKQFRSTRQGPGKRDTLLLTT
jgi:hypothetical protein